MNSTLATRIAQEHAAVAAVLPAQVIDNDRRRRAIQSLVEQGLPTHRDENWRYANLHTLEHARFAPSVQPPQQSIAAGSLPAPIKDYARYTFVDGLFAPALSTAALSANVSRSSQSDASIMPARIASSAAMATSQPDASSRPARFLSSAAIADGRMALLNEAFATDGARIVATDAHQPLCIEVIFLSSANPQAGAAYPRLTVVAQPHTHLGLIERHLSLGNETQFINGAVEIELMQGASVDHYRLQQTGRETTWMDTLSARLAADASYRVHLANLGAQASRSTLQIALEGDRSSVVLNAVSVPDRLQVHDVFAVIEHLGADTKTEQRFRGIAAENARVGFNGKIVVRENAHRTVSRQSLRGLLAGSHAEVDVRPQLEIYTDDVQCSHGATAGKLDDTMLFYLLSRGLERETAQLLLKWAFLEDVVAKIDLPELRRQIEQTLAGQMDDAAALREML